MLIQMQWTDKHYMQLNSTKNLHRDISKYKFEYSYSKHAILNRQSLELWGKPATDFVERERSNVHLVQSSATD